MLIIAFFFSNIAILKLHCIIPYGGDNMAKVYYEHTDINDLQKIFCGIFRADNFPSHIHHEIEIISPINEPLRMIFENHIVDLIPGDIIIINSMEPHSIMTFNNNCNHFVLQLDTMNIFKDLNSLRHKKCSPNVISKQLPEIYSGIHKYIDSIIYLLNNHDDACCNIKINCYTGLLLTYIFENLEWKERKEAVNRNSPSKLQAYNKATEYILANFTKKITLKDVADFVNLSTFHFCRLFKQFSGKTFIEYVTDLRLSHAESMLISEKEKIIDIAEKSGFGSVKTFNQLFKKKHSMSPVEFRKHQDNTVSVKKQHRTLHAL